MNSILNYANKPRASSLQYFFWLHPEWWSKALCGLAWVVMLGHGWQHAAHQLHHPMTFGQELSYWLVMVGAMMLPLVMGRVWVTAAGSLWVRRHRAIAGFLLGYFSPWLVFGAAAAVLRGASLTHTYAAPALGFLTAAVWQLTPMHRRALTACHRTVPLAPVGWRADRDCLHFGAAVGNACVWSCWPLMLACALAGHGLIALAGGTAVSAAERWSFRLRKRVVPAATLAIAAYYFGMAALA